MTESVSLGVYDAAQTSTSSPTTDAGTAVKGYGKPTTGDYAVANKGQYKMFGTLGQGSKQEGVKEIGSNSCEPRNMVVTVYAKQNLASLNVKLELGSYSFES